MKHIIHLFLVVLLSMAFPSTLFASVNEGEALAEEVFSEIPVFGNMNSNEFADPNGNVDCDIVIFSGGILTVTETLRMAANRVISVERGGKLIVQGGTITAQTEGNNQVNRWGGIYAAGNPHLPQTAANQATVIVNKGEIKFADVGIACRKLSGGEFTGGAIVKCTNSTFTNNWRGIEFLLYPNTDSIPRVDNISKVIGCRFELKDTYLSSDNEYLAHITTWKNFGLHFEGNHFELASELTDLNGFERAALQLRRTDAKVIDNVFVGHHLGLGWENDGADESITTTLENNLFARNIDGANIQVANLTAFDNRFLLRYGDNSSTGMTVRNSPRFTIEDNRFQAGRTGTGLIINNSRDNNNTVRYNTFIRLNVGLDAKGQNRGASNGLNILCNDFLSNLTDIKITSTGQFLQGIHPEQTGGGDSGAGNTFNQSDVNIDNDGLNFRYHYFATPPATVQGNVDLEEASIASLCGESNDQNEVEGGKLKIGLEATTHGLAKVYPNPTSSQFNVALPAGFSEANGKVEELYLIDLAGRRMSASYNLSPTGLEVNLSTFRTGTYHVALVTKTGIINVGKIVKQ